jgi:uncharacterized membrane protein (DUF2068 family)
MELARETAPEARPRGVSAIIVYKLAKAVVELPLAALTAVLIGFGLAARVHVLALHVREHVGGAWTARLAGALLGAADHLWLVVVALVFDAVESSLEGWALYRGFRWAPWLVVVATSALLPFELVEVARHAHPTRILVLAVNVLIVVYLARRALSRSSRGVYPPARAGGS